MTSATPGPYTCRGSIQGTGGQHPANCISERPAHLQTFLQISTMRRWSASEYFRMLLPSSCFLLLDMEACCVLGRNDAFMQLRCRLEACWQLSVYL